MPGLSDDQQKQTYFRSNNPFNALVSQPPSTPTERPLSCSAAQREWEKFLIQRRIEVEHKSNEAVQQRTIPCRSCGCVSVHAPNKPQSSHPFVNQFCAPPIQYAAESSSLGSYASPSSTPCSMPHTMMSYPHISLVPSWSCLYTTYPPLTTTIPLYHLHSPSRPSTAPITSARESRGFHVPYLSPHSPSHHCFNMSYGYDDSESVNR